MKVFCISIILFFEIQVFPLDSVSIYYSDTVQAIQRNDPSYDPAAYRLKFNYIGDKIKYPRAFFFLIVATDSHLLIK